MMNAKWSYHSNVKDHVGRQVEEENNARYSRKTVQFGCGQEMAWVCIKSDGRKELIKADGNLNIKNYISY